MESNKRPKKTLGPAVGRAEVDEGKVRDEYAVDKFYIASTDKHHNHEKIRISQEKAASTLRVPTFVWALIMKWVNDPMTPYRSVADFARDCFVHRLHDLQELADEGTSPAWRGMRLQVEMAHRADEAARHKETVEWVKTMMKSAWADGDFTLYSELTNGAEELLPEIPEPYAAELREFLSGQKNLRRLKETGDG